MTEFADRILAIDVHVARYCAQLPIPDKRSENDALIASTAYLHKMIIVTRNIKDFIDMGPELLDPWEAA